MRSLALEATSAGSQLRTRDSNVTREPVRRGLRERHHPIALPFAETDGKTLRNRVHVVEIETMCFRVTNAGGVERFHQLLGLAQALNVSVEDLVGSNGTKKLGTGPTGKMKQLFEAASQLPRSQQQKITAVLEAFVNQHALR